MLVIFKVFGFGYVKSYFMPSWKRHQDGIVRKSKDVYQMKDSDVPEDALGIIFRLQLNFRSLWLPVLH